GPGPPVWPAAADHRFHPAAPRHHARRVLLPRGVEAAGRQRRERLRPGGYIPLSRPQAADAREWHRHAGRRRREHQPVAARPGAEQSAEAGARSLDEEIAGWPVRGERPDTDRAAQGRAEPVEELDCAVPRSDQVSGGEGDEDCLVRKDGCYFWWRSLSP